MLERFSVVTMPDGSQYVLVNGMPACAGCAGGGIEGGVGRNGEIRCRACRGTGNPPPGAYEHAAEVA